MSNKPHLVGDVAASHPDIAAPAANHILAVVGAVIWALSMRWHTDCGSSQPGCNPFQKRDRARHLMQKDEPEITASDVVELVQLLQQNHIDVCLDGGWGVDALLGEQTRPHADLDIAVQHKDVPRVRVLLEARGYKDVPRDDTRDCNFVLGDDQGRQIDVHSYTFDSAGNHVYGVKYPADSLTGSGSVNGYPVRCISPEWMVKFHLGYEFDVNDYRDVRALCQRFGIEMPPEYRRFERVQFRSDVAIT
jgi:lincosamide nucleotidyltransferase A/C/D/E